MPENPTTALVKTTQSPALARVSNQLALTDKLLTDGKFLVYSGKKSDQKSSTNSGLFKGL